MNEGYDELIRSIVDWIIGDVLPAYGVASEVGQNDPELSESCRAAVQAALDAAEPYATLRYCERQWSEERGVMIDKLMAAREALKAMLRHSCVADSASEDKFQEDHDAERAARRVIEGLGGWLDIGTAPQDGTHVLVRFEGTTSPPTVAHWFGPPALPGLRAGGWYLSVQQLEGPAIHPTHWRHVPA